MYSRSVARHNGIVNGNTEYTACEEKKNRQQVSLPLVLISILNQGYKRTERKMIDVLMWANLLTSLCETRLTCNYLIQINYSYNMNDNDIIEKEIPENIKHSFQKLFSEWFHLFPGWIHFWIVSRDKFRISQSRYQHRLPPPTTDPSMISTGYKTIFFSKTVPFINIVSVNDWI